MKGIDILNIKKLLKIVLLLCLFLIISCQDKTTKTTNNVNDDFTLQPLAFQKIDSSQSHIQFANTILDDENFNILQYEYIYNGGGVAVGDINNDGLQDIYFVGNMTQDRLYLNKGNFVFEDITYTSGIDGQKGYKSGVNMIDVNQDGLLDIYVCRSALSKPELRANLLYINNGDNTFTERAKEFGLDDQGYSVQAYFFDADLDGDYEVYVLNHPKNMTNANNLKVKQKNNGEFEVNKPETFDFISDRYYVKANGRYKDVSKQAGIIDDAFGLSAVVSDFNGDHLPDIFVANDYSKPDRLYINQGNHQYKDEIKSYFKHTSFSSMGSDFSDLNNDLKPDLMVLDMMASISERRHVLNLSQNLKTFKLMKRIGFGAQLARNVLQINNASNLYSEIALMDGLGTTDWSWSVLMADFNNDKYKDIHITNGYFRNITDLDYVDYRINELRDQYNSGVINAKDWLKEIPSIPTQNFFFKNQGDLEFKDVSTQWNAQTVFSNGAAYADFDNDGYLDLVVNNMNGVAHLLRNDMGDESQNYISIKLSKDDHASVINTKVYAFLSDGSSMVQEYNPQRGFLSTSQHQLHFGLGEARIDSLKIIWPDQSKQILNSPEINQTLNVSKQNGLPKVETAKTEPKMFAAKDLDINPHVENDYNEFDFERLMDRSYSEFGPASLVLDFNQDGREDLFLGGSSGYASQLFQQQPNGKFKKLKVTEFENDKFYEDVSAVVINANDDQYPDIIVSSASNELALKTENFPVRLYVYNSKSKTYEREEFSDVAVSSTSILVNDFDGDGLDDVFVAGRNHPKYYPEIPQSYVFKQTSNGFEDYTSRWLDNPFIAMLTDLVIVDLNQDNKDEIVMVGEWMSPQIFSFDNGFKNITSNFNLSDFNGLWESAHAADVNNDGYMDLILGNRGLNNIYKAKPDSNLKMIYGDIDNNYTKEYLMFHQENGNYEPLLGLKRTSKQLPSMRKQFNSYHAYADYDWSKLLKQEGLKTYTVDVLEHHLLLNNKGTGFSKQQLPHFTQNSLLKSIETINHNETTYFVLAGNHYETDAEFSIYDASNGHVMTWNTDQNEFELLDVEETGFVADKDVRSLEQISIKDKKHIIVINNDDKVDGFYLK